MGLLTPLGLGLWLWAHPRDSWTSCLDYTLVMVAAALAGLGMAIAVQWNCYTRLHRTSISCHALGLQDLKRVETKSSDSNRACSQDPHYQARDS